jgi:hypothetical protein
MILNIIGWFWLLSGYVFALNDKGIVALYCYGIAVVVFVSNIVYTLSK